MRILFINETCGYLGGVEQIVADTAAGLRKHGYTCFLAFGVSTSQDTGTYQTHFDGCFQCPELQPSPPPIRFDHLPQLLQQLAPDVIYVHKVTTVPPTLLRHCPVPTIRMVHDHDVCCPRRHKYFALTGRVCHHKAGWRCWVDGAFLAREARTRTGLTLVSITHKLQEMRRNHAFDRLLVGSRFMREELLQNGFPPTKVHILPPVAHLPMPQAPPPLPIEPHILYVGQMIHGKGVDLLLQALRHVDYPYTATLIGAGNAYERLVNLHHRLGLAGRVRFLGWINHEQLGRYYADATVVAVPSRWPEPFGMIGLEAMQHGRPVVAFDVGGIADWLSHRATGFLVPEQDVHAFGAALQHLLTTPDVATTLGQNAYTIVQERFNFAHYLDRLEMHLHSVRKRPSQP